MGDYNIVKAEEILYHNYNFVKNNNTIMNSIVNVVHHNRLKYKLSFDKTTYI